VAGREERSRRILSLVGRRRLTREGSSPCREEEAYVRRLETSPKGQRCQARGMRMLQGDLLSPPGNVHGGRAAVVHYRGLAEVIILATGAVMTDKTGWLCPIGAARQAA
jgi:hypothetical protein